MWSLKVTRVEIRRPYLYKIRVRPYAFFKSNGIRCIRKGKVHWNASEGGSSPAVFLVPNSLFFDTSRLQLGGGFRSGFPDRFPDDFLAAYGFFGVEGAEIDGIADIHIAPIFLDMKSDNLDPCVTSRRLKQAAD
jgi:hypothetical protein